MSNTRTLFKTVVSCVKIDIYIETPGSARRSRSGQFMKARLRKVLLTENNNTIICTLGLKSILCTGA